MCEEIKRYLWVASQSQSAHVCVEFCADCFSYGEDGLPVGGSSRAPRCSGGHVGHRWACVGVSMRISVGGMGRLAFDAVENRKEKNALQNSASKVAALCGEQPWRCVEKRYQRYGLAALTFWKSAEAAASNKTTSPWREPLHASMMTIKCTHIRRSLVSECTCEGRAAPCQPAT